jgi:hypothetical protein
VAILSIAGSLNSLLALVLPFRQILFPIMSRLSSESGATSFVGRRIAKYSVWFNTILIAGAAVVAPFAVSLVAPKYLAAVPVFDFLALSQIINALSTSHGMLFYALSKSFC